MYVILSIICFVVNYSAELMAFGVGGALFATGHLIQSVGNETATYIIKMLVPVCVVLSVILSSLITLIVWRHYEDTVSRGVRRWISNLTFFQNRVGYTAFTLIVSLVFNFMFIYSVAILLVCYVR